MDNVGSGMKPMKGFLEILLVFQAIVYIAVIFNAPVLRQIAGFVYLTFVPGFTVFELIKIKGLGISGRLLLSVGLSLSIMMVLGVLVNAIGLVLGIAYPMSPIVILTGIGAFLVIISFLLHRTRHLMAVWRPQIRLSFLLWLVLPVTIVLATVFGTMAVNNHSGHLILLGTIALISVLIFEIIMRKKLFSEELLPFALFAVSLSLILQFFLMTPYLSGGGGDIFSEYYVFRLLHNTGSWIPNLQLADFEASKANPMLSVTILPEIYSKVLGIDGVWAFKFVMPFLAAVGFSLGLYSLYKTQTDHKTAGLAIFLFVASSVGLGWGPGKQLIGEFFFISLFFILLAKDFSSMQRKILFTIFGFGLIVSHYSLAYIFLGIVVVAWVVSFLMKKRIHISLSQIMLFFAMAFAWYIFTSGSTPFVALVNTADFIYRSVMTDFFNPQSRGQSVLRGVGAVTAESPLHYAGRFFFYITELFIIVGFLRMIIKKDNFVFEYRMFGSISLALLGLNIIVPGFAGRFLAERWYVTTLMILAPLCVVGGQTILEFLSKHLHGRLDKRVSAILLTATVLIPFFLFNSGFVYEIAGDNSYSIPLSMYRMDSVRLHDSIVEAQEVSGAAWLASSINSTGFLVYADSTSMFHALEPYGLIGAQYFKILENTTTHIPPQSFIYLRWTNINTNFSYGEYYAWDLNDISYFLGDQNTAYSNGNCMIYASTAQK
jgi:uncharacterized membrane protein